MRHLVFVDEGAHEHEIAPVAGAIFGAGVFAIDENFGVLGGADALEPVFEHEDQTLIRHVRPAQQAEGFGTELALEHAEFTAEAAPPRLSNCMTRSRVASRGSLSACGSATDCSGGPGSNAG